MTTSLHRSSRCLYQPCRDKPGCVYATLTVNPSQSQISVHLQGTPCCVREFDSLLNILREIRKDLNTENHLYLHYTLTNVTLDKKRMLAQEAVLSGPPIVCAIVCTNRLVRTAVRVATSLRSGVKTFACLDEGYCWLQAQRDAVSKKSRV